MRAGQLRKRLSFDQRLDTPDGAGGVTSDWVEVTRLWGSVTAKGHGERLRAQQVQNPVTHTVVVRYTTAVTPDMRMRLGARVFAIRSAVDEGEGRRWLTLEVEEEVAV